MTPKTRLGLVAGYLGLLLLGVAVICVLYRSYDSVVLAGFRIAAIWLHALPLLLTKFYEDMQFGGPDPKAKGALVFLAIVAVQWWPLVIFSVFPRLWALPVIHRVTIGYLVAVLMLSIGAAVWLTIEPSLLAS